MLMSKLHYDSVTSRNFRLNFGEAMQQQQQHQHNHHHHHNHHNNNNHHHQHSQQQQQQQQQPNYINQLLSTAATGTGVVNDVDALLGPMPTTGSIAVPPIAAANGAAGLAHLPLPRFDQQQQQQQLQQQQQQHHRPERNLWRTDEILQMLHIMQQLNAIELLNDKSVKSDKVFRNIETLMHHSGYRKKSHMQIWTKWKFLKSTYTTSKRNGVMPKMIAPQIYEELHKMLGQPSNGHVASGRGSDCGNSMASVDGDSSNGAPYAASVVENGFENAFDNGLDLDHQSQQQQQQQHQQQQQQHPHAHAHAHQHHHHQQHEQHEHSSRLAEEAQTFAMGHPIFGFRLGLVKQEPIDTGYETATNNGTISEKDALEDHNANSSCSSAANTHFQVQIKQEKCDDKPPSPPPQPEAQSVAEPDSVSVATTPPPPPPTSDAILPAEAPPSELAAERPALPLPLPLTLPMPLALPLSLPVPVPVPLPLPLPSPPAVAQSPRKSKAAPLRIAPFAKVAFNGQEHSPPAPTAPPTRDYPKIHFINAQDPHGQGHGRKANALNGCKEAINGTTNGLSKQWKSSAKAAPVVPPHVPDLSHVQFAKALSMHARASPQQQQQQQQHGHVGRPRKAHAAKPQYPPYAAFDASALAAAHLMSLYQEQPSTSKQAQQLPTAGMPPRKRNPRLPLPLPLPLSMSDALTASKPPKLPRLDLGAPGYGTLGEEEHGKEARSGRKRRGMQPANAAAELQVGDEVKGSGTDASLSEETFGVLLESFSASFRAMQREIMSDYFAKQMELARREHAFQTQQDLLFMRAFQDQNHRIMTAIEKLGESSERRTKKRATQRHPHHHNHPKHNHNPHHAAMQSDAPEECERERESSTSNSSSETTEPDGDADHQAVPEMGGTSASSDDDDEEEEEEEEEDEDDDDDECEGEDENANEHEESSGQHAKRPLESEEQSDGGEQHNHTHNGHLNGRSSDCEMLHPDHVHLQHPGTSGEESQEGEHHEAGDDDDMEMHPSDPDADMDADNVPNPIELVSSELADE